MSTTNDKSIAMYDGISRTLAISAKGLRTPITLLLSFTPPDPAKSEKEVLRTCWKALHLKKGDFTEIEVVVKPNLAFIALQKDAGNFVDASSSARCNPGQKCTIVDDGVTKAVPGGGENLLTCINETKVPVNVALAFCDSDGGNVEPILVWDKVSPQTKIEAEFTPILGIYLSPNKEISGAVVERPLLWKKNLNDLDIWTDLRVTVDDDSGKILIADAD